MTKAVKNTAPIFEEQLEYFKDESGNLIDASAPLDKEIAITFMTDIANNIHNIEVESFQDNCFNI